MKESAVTAICAVALLIIGIPILGILMSAEQETVDGDIDEWTPPAL